MKRIRYKGFIFMTMTVMMVSLCVSIAFGAGQSSENYYMELDVFDGGGGWCTSTNYAISHATAQSTPIGYSESSSYRVYAGFFFPAIWYVPISTLPTQRSSILAPSGLGFGEVATSSSRNLNLIMNNTTDANINVDPITVGPSAPFDIIDDGCGSTTLHPGDTCTVTVQFSPVSTGNFYGYFLIPTDDPEAATLRVNLSGAGVTE
jgi:hypothetical protein